MGRRGIGAAATGDLALDLFARVPSVARGVSSGSAIQRVGSGTPADEAGLRPGDVIVAFGDAKIASPEDLLAALRDHEPGERVSIEYVRDGKTDTTTATLANRPDRA
jgi:S1-C subfamily serine protease